MTPVEKEFFQKFEFTAEEVREDERGCFKRIIS